VDFICGCFTLFFNLKLSYKCSSFSFQIHSTDLTEVYVALQVTIKFQIPPACEISQLIANLVSHLGLKVEERGGGSDMLLRAWDRLSHF
jgi:hypothetical protein